MGGKLEMMIVFNSSRLTIKDKKKIRSRKQYTAYKSEGLDWVSSVRNKKKDCGETSCFNPAL